MRTRVSSLVPPERVKGTSRRRAGRRRRTRAAPDRPRLRAEVCRGGAADLVRRRARRAPQRVTRPWHRRQARAAAILNSIPMSSGRASMLKTRPAFLASLTFVALACVGLSAIALS